MDNDVNKDNGPNVFDLTMDDNDVNNDEQFDASFPDFDAFDAEMETAMNLPGQVIETDVLIDKSIHYFVFLSTQDEFGNDDFDLMDGDFENITSNWHWYVAMNFCDFLLLLNRQIEFELNGKFERFGYNLWSSYMRRSVESSRKNAWE